MQLPPIRNSLQKKKKKKVTKQTDASADRQPRERKIRGYDYRAWDKFDVVGDS